MKTVEWTDRAMADFRRTARYLAFEFGGKAVEKFEKNIAEWEARIARNPGIGLREPLLAKRSEGFRSVVIHKNCKIIYYEEGSVLRIAALWDTRREPATQSSDTK